MVDEKQEVLTPEQCYETIRSLFEKDEKYGSEDAQAFTDAWDSLAKKYKNGSLSEKLIALLFDGFDIAGAEPLYRYALQIGSAEPYKKVFRSERGRQNKQSKTMKLALNLLACELVLPATSDSVEVAANFCCINAYGKAGKLSPSVKTSVEACLIQPLSKADISADASITSDRASRLMNVLEVGIENTLSKKSVKPSIREAAESLREWLKRQRMAVAGSHTIFGEKASITSAHESLPTANSVDKRSSKSSTLENFGSDDEAMRVGRGGDASKPASKNTSKKSKSLDDSAGQEMASVIKFLRKYERQHKELAQRLKDADAEKKEALKRLELLAPKVKRLERENQKLEDLRSSISANYATLKQNHDALLSESERQRKELAEAEEMIDLLSEGSAHDSKSAVDRLANDLRHDYRKYLDATKEPMTAELGSIVLGQLETVFKVLAEHGISFE